MSTALIRSTNRRGTATGKTTPVGRNRLFHDPSVCHRCGAVYTAKTWRRGRRMAGADLAKAMWVLCPGCEQAAGGEYYGQVLVEVKDAAGRDAIMARVRNVERRALATQPERRIVEANWDGKRLDIKTTSQKLAHRIACEVEKAFGGVLHFSWSAEDGTLLATVKFAPAKARAKGGPKRKATAR